MNTNKIKYLDRTRERNLIKDYQENGNSDALHELMEAHAAYVQKVATVQFKKFGKIVEYEDLLQQGKVGLLKGIRKFDLSMQRINPDTNRISANQALLTYAHQWIIAEMQNLFHRSHATHIPAHTLRAIYYNVKDPGCNTEERKALAKRSMRAEPIDGQNQEYGADRRKYSVHDIPSNIERDPTFEEGIRNIFSPEVQKALDMLTSLEKEIFNLHYGLEEGVRLKTTAIANKLHMSTEQVEKKLNRAIRILTKNINRELVMA